MPPSPNGSAWGSRSTRCYPGGRRGMYIKLTQSSCSYHRARFDTCSVTSSADSSRGHTVLRGHEGSDQVPENAKGPGEMQVMFLYRLRRFHEAAVGIGPATHGVLLAPWSHASAGLCHQSQTPKCVPRGRVQSLSPCVSSLAYKSSRNGVTRSPDAILHTLIRAQYCGRSEDVSRTDQRARGEPSVHGRPQEKRMQRATAILRDGRCS